MYSRMLTTETDSSSGKSVIGHVICDRQGWPAVAWLLCCMTGVGIVSLATESIPGKDVA